MKKKKFYRLALVEDETHKQIGAYRFTKSSAVLTGVTAIVVILALAYCLFALTPLRATIPGYPDARSRKQAIENAIRIDSLENIITRWELYSENLSRVLSGEQTIDLDSIVRGTSTKYLKNIAISQAEEQDSLLKQKMRQDSTKE